MPHCPDLMLSIGLVCTTHQNLGFDDHKITKEEISDYFPIQIPHTLSSVAPPLLVGTGIHTINSPQREQSRMKWIYGAVSVSLWSRSLLSLFSLIRIEIFICHIFCGMALKLDSNLPFEVTNAWIGMIKQKRFRIWYENLVFIIL